MKLSKFVKRAKSESYCMVIHADDSGIWLGTRSALYNATDKPGQYSFEARMACGFGACMGCTCKTKYGAKRICKDGPVLQKEEIVW